MCSHEICCQNARELASISGGSKLRCKCVFCNALGTSYADQRAGPGERTVLVAREYYASSLASVLQLVGQPTCFKALYSLISAYSVF